MKTLAITGLFNPMGRHMGRLAASMSVRVLGIDVKPLTRPFPGVKFIQTDVRNPLLADLFKTEKVDTVLHCAFRWRLHSSDEGFDSNVLGALRLLEACETARVRKIVVPSSTFVYGAVADNPAFLCEESAFRGQPTYAYVRELREIETLINGYRRQQNGMIITVLRFANLLGGGLRSPLARYLALPAAPTLLGFEPRLQVLHYTDALRVLGQCLLQDHDGVFNIAADPPLPLYQLLALARTPPLPIVHPLAYRGLAMGRVLSQRSAALAAMPWDYLRYTWVADTGRMQDELDFRPTHDARQTVREFGESLWAYRRQHSKLFGTLAATRDDLSQVHGTCCRISRRLVQAASGLSGRHRSQEVNA